MRIAALCGCLCLLALTGASGTQDVPYELQPTPSDLWDLDHSEAYTWGLSTLVRK